MQVNRVAVVGAGTMGSSITVALISRGFPVILKDVDDAAVATGLANIDRMLKSRVDKGLSPEEAENQRALVTTAVDYKGFAEIDLVIEAVPESAELKRKCFVIWMSFAMSMLCWQATPPVSPSRSSALLPGGPIRLSACTSSIRRIS